MGLLDLFKSQEEKQKLSHIKNVVAVALADGTVKNSELVAIAAICDREGIDPKEIERCIKNPQKVNFTPPKDHATKVRYLQDMVLLMMCDGDLDAKEYITCKLCAEALGFRHEVIDALINDIIEDLKNSL